MANINNHRVGMNKINLAGDFQQLTCEQAAAIQGGAQILLFTDINFSGTEGIVSTDRAGVQAQLTGNLNNSISSARVISGTWDLRSEPDGSGVGITLGPGDYSDFRTGFDGGSFNDIASLVIATVA